MPTEKETLQLHEWLARMRQEIVHGLADQLTQDPALMDLLDHRLDDLEKKLVEAEIKKAIPPDRGFAQLIGLGDETAPDLGSTRLPLRVEDYDEAIAAERIAAVADLYYVYQIEKAGVFRAMQKLKQLFKAGTLRLSTGPGAFALYQYDKREVLRYTHLDRAAAYRRVFGYGSAPLAPGAKQNLDFHHLFVHFINEVTQYWRDKRISDVIRERALDPGFGAMATVRRAALDLRNNLKWASYGYVNVLRVEVMQLLEDAFVILNSDDVKRQFGAENGWDVVEEILVRYFNQKLYTSPRQHMANTGREILQWVGTSFVLETNRIQFEALLDDIAGVAEEWMTSAESLGLAQRQVARHTVPWEKRPAMTGKSFAHHRHTVTMPPSRFTEREIEPEG